MEADQPKADVWASAPSRLLGFRMNAPRAAMTLPLSVDGKAVPLRVALAGGEAWATTGRGTSRSRTAGRWTTSTCCPRPTAAIRCTCSRAATSASSTSPQGRRAHAAASDGAILSPMPGKIVSVAVEAGQAVVKGQTLLTLEAMKMEHALAAPFDGVVAELSAVAGGQVSEGVVLAKLEPVA
jgi:biotin carboxyl carrier protein